jgi:hypothetical protein
MDIQTKRQMDTHPDKYTDLQLDIKTYRKIYVLTDR